jgi:pyrroloquinoline quinone biosynthesis protein D
MSIRLPSCQEKARDDGVAIVDRGKRRHPVCAAWRFRFDERRKAWIVLAPERLMLPDEQAVAILRLIDGKRDVDAIIDELAGQFDAPRNIIDVAPMLQDLVDKKVLRQ